MIHNPSLLLSYLNQWSDKPLAQWPSWLTSSFSAWRENAAGRVEAVNHLGRIYRVAEASRAKPVFVESPSKLL